MIDDKMAKMAINTLKEYCKNLCSRCAVYGSCGQRYCYFENVDGYNDVGTFENLQKSPKKPPKFDIRQKESADFRNYINEIFLREAEKYGLPMNKANSIKWTARGTIVVTFVDDDNKTNYFGWAKCHPDDAFNPEVGIKLAIERAAQAMKAPFVPEENEAYYYADDENRIYSTINHNTNTDILNIALGNCFRKRKEAHANKEAIRKRMERAKVLLKSLREDDANAMGRCK
ncbi:hypothetical protein WMO23_05920 [Megasphaera sp. CLA-AA-H81]|uniref:Phage protein n=1 Tax=Megasphaera intestinihominis TaxID=3133159 RepID=A0ABV1CXP1_9FIRM